MAKEQFSELLSLVIKHFFSSVKDPQISRDSFMLLAEYMMVEERQNGVQEFTFHISLATQNPKKQAEGEARVKVDFARGTIEFLTLPTRLGGHGIEEIKIAVLRTLGTLTLTPEGKYCQPSIEHQAVAIPLNAHHTLSPMVMLIYVCQVLARNVTYTNLDLNRCSIDAIVREGLTPHRVHVALAPTAPQVLATCDCNDFVHHQGLYSCPHIRAAMCHIYEQLPRNFFDPNYTESHLMREILKETPKENPVHKNGQLIYNEHGEYMVKGTQVKVLKDSSYTVEELGLNEALLNPDIPLSYLEQSERNTLFFTIEPDYDPFNRNIIRYCEVPIPAKGKIGKSGKINLNFSSLNFERLNQQLSQLTSQQIADASRYLDYLRKCTTTYVNHDPSPVNVALLHKASPILAQYQVYFFVNKYEVDNPAYAHLDRLTPLTLHSDHIEATLQLQWLQSSERIFQLHTTLRAGEIELEIDPTTTLLNEAFMILNYSDLYLFRSAADYQLARRMILEQLDEVNAIRYPADELPKLYDTVIKPLGKHFEITSEVHPKQPIVEKHITPQLFITDASFDSVTLTPAMQYGDDSIPLTDRAPLYDAESHTLLLRDSDRESQYLDYLRSLHPTFDHQMTQFTLTAEQLIEESWFLTTSEKLRQRGVQIFGAEKLQNFRFNLHTPTISISTSSGIDWFDLKIDVAFGKQRVPLRELRKSVMNRSQYVPLSDGTLGILPEEWLERYTKYFKVGRLQKDKLEISNYQFNIIDQLTEDLPRQPKYIKEMMERRHKVAKPLPHHSAPYP